MDNDRVNKKVFLWAMEASNNKCHNWCWKIKNHLGKLGLSWLVDYNVSQSVFIQAIDGAMSDYVKSLWNTDLWREEAKSGRGQNKLRTFRHLKSDFRTEPYITCIIPRVARSSCAKFRCGVAPLQIELGRYIGQPEYNRLCLMCQNDVESEFHVLIDCDFYSDITQDLMECAQDIDLRFNNMCSFDKFCFLMSHEQLQVDSAKACQKFY